MEGSAHGERLLRACVVRLLELRRKSGGNLDWNSSYLARTAYSAVIDEMPLDDVLSHRERINEELRQKLDEITERWRIKVTQVEIREIEPTRDIQEAMNRQMSAERVRRAVVLEADGTREAAITIADGEKQAGE